MRLLVGEAAIGADAAADLVVCWHVRRCSFTVSDDPRFPEPRSMRSPRPIRYSTAAWSGAATAARALSTACSVTSHGPLGEHLDDEGGDDGGVDAAASRRHRRALRSPAAECGMVAPSRWRAVMSTGPRATNGARLALRHRLQVTPTGGVLPIRPARGNRAPAASSPARRDPNASPSAHLLAHWRGARRRPDAAEAIGGPTRRR